MELQQERYLWGSGGEANICRRRLVVNDPNAHGGVPSLLFHCTRYGDHRGPHIATMVPAGPVRHIEVSWFDEACIPESETGAQDDGGRDERADCGVDP